MPARTTRHIVALGGGGFSMEPRNPLLDDFVLSLARRQKARVCFLPTASGDNEGYIQRFYRHFANPRKRRCIASHLPLFKRVKPDVERFLLSQDVIYVGGGNTANMLAVWRMQGVDRILLRAWNQGIVLAGVSAGANCWFEACSTDSFGPLAPLRDGLGLLRGSVCPHYDGEKRRAASFRRWIARGDLPDGIALEDGAAAHFIGRRLVEAVGSRPHAKAYRVQREHRSSIQTMIPVRYLGSSSHLASIP